VPLLSYYEENIIMTVRRLLPVILTALLALSATAQVIPQGTRISVRTGSELNSGKATVGHSWQDSLTKPLIVDGKTIANTGSTVPGKVTVANSSGRLHAPRRA